MATTTLPSFLQPPPTCTPRPSYTEEKLKTALFYNTTNDEIKNNNYKNRHIHGYNDRVNHSLSMLQTITATVLLDYDETKRHATKASLDEVQQQANIMLQTYGPVLNLQTVIQKVQPKMALAAEFKRASPSKGTIVSGATSAGEQALIYQTAGADIISVLTEPYWFQGSLYDLYQARQSTSTPVAQPSNGVKYHRNVAILRKDFIMNEHMICEAIAAGADAVLLIVAILPQDVLTKLIDYCRKEYSIEPLVEVHTNLELEVAVQSGATVIGINNRNLHTFQLDMSTSERIAHQLQQYTTTTTNEPKKEYTLCALSGMSTCYDVDRYRKVGISMCLIGESLMRSYNPAAAISSLCLHPNDFQNSSQQSQQDDDTTNENGTNSTTSASAYIRGTQLIKICGITSVQDAMVACQSGANLIGIIFATKSKRKMSDLAVAKEIVTAVRQFGERTERFTFISDNNTSPASTTNGSSPIVHLIGTSRQLMQTMKHRPGVVGVFQNQDPSSIQQIVDECGIDFIQLHGNEGMTACNSNIFGGIPVIRVIDIPTTVNDNDTTNNNNDDKSGTQDTIAADEMILQSLTNDPFAILLDTSIKGAAAGGGTGIAFDWNIVPKLQNCGLPVIIAGGLTPETIGTCIESVRPFGVDVSSGVEDTVPGIKNHDKIKRFIHTARAAAIEASKGF